MKSYRSTARTGIFELWIDISCFKETRKAGDICWSKIVALKQPLNYLKKRKSSVNNNDFSAGAFMCFLQQLKIAVAVFFKTTMVKYFIGSNILGWEGLMDRHISSLLKWFNGFLYKFGELLKIHWYGQLTI